MKGKVVVINGIEFDQYTVKTSKQEAVVLEEIETEEEKMLREQSKLEAEKNIQKEKLLDDMIKANALRDDVAWQLAKDLYDGL